MTATVSSPELRHPNGCCWCPAEPLGLERATNGDPLCNTCPHLREKEASA